MTATARLCFRHDRAVKPVTMRLAQFTLAILLAFLCSVPISSGTEAGGTSVTGGGPCAQSYRGLAPLKTFPRTVHVGMDAGGLAISERSGHVFVIVPGPHTGRHYACAGTVQMLSARSGALLRTVMVSTGPSQVAVDDTTGRVFILSIGGPLQGPGIVTVLDTHTGALLHTKQVNDSFSWGGQMVISHRAGRVFLVPGYYGSQRVYALDAATGAQLYTLPFTGTPLVDERSNRLLLLPPGSLSPFRSDTVWLVDAVTGRLVGSTTIGYCFPATAVLSGHAQTAFLGGTGNNKTDNQLCVLDAVTGSVLQRVNLGPAGAANLLAVDDPAGVVFSAEGNLFSLSRFRLIARDTRDGAVVHDLGPALPRPASAVDGSTGELYLATGGSHVRLLDPRTWRFIRTLEAAGTPVAIAVSERFRTVFVIASGTALLTIFCPSGRCAS
jgi:DNA-binding beta-propeller fold protein YncE